MPTTYVWSDGDVAIGRTAAEACAQLVTGDYRFVELPGVTHWIPEQAPEQLAAAILDRIASELTGQAASEAAARRPAARRTARAGRSRRKPAVTAAAAGDTSPRGEDRG